METTDFDLNAMSEITQARKKAMLDVITNKYKKLYNLRFELGLLGNDPFGVPWNDLRKDIAELQKQMDKKDTSNYMWITISIAEAYFVPLDEPPQEPIDDVVYKLLPREEIIECTNHRLMKKALKFANSAMFSDYLFVMEQRESEFNAKRAYCGQHFHFLVRRTKKYPPSQVDRNTRRVWKDLCDTTKTPKQQRTPCHIVQCPAEYFNDKVEYMVGKKTGKKKNGEDKATIQAVDKTFRKHFKFKDLYYKISDDQLFALAIDKLSQKNKI